MPSEDAQFAIRRRNWCRARRNLQGARGLIQNWLVADVGQRVIRVELRVCLVLLEAIHFHRIDQLLDDAAITLDLQPAYDCRLRVEGNDVVWSAACATSLRPQPQR